MVKSYFVLVEGFINPEGYPATFVENTACSHDAIPVHHMQPPGVYFISEKGALEWTERMKKVYPNNKMMIRSIEW